MSILFSNFAIEKVINMRARCNKKSTGQWQKKMTEPIYYNLKIDWKRDFILEQAIRKEMQYLWERSCFMVPRTGVDDHYWGVEIDYLADIMLQIYNHSNF